MNFFRLFCFTVTLCLMGVSGVSAQDAPTDSLGELAARSDFYVGAAVSIPLLRNDAVYAETLARQFNMVTPENVMKMETLQPERGRFDFSQGDTLVNFAEAHGMRVRGHTLVWHNQLPRWLTSGTFSRDEAIQLLHDHIYTVLGHYKGRIAVWDVVNEAIADDGSGLRDTPWRDLIGDDYIELAFQFAHEADPDALLFYNDYGAEGSGAKSNAVYAMVQDLLDKGVPINGVGLQSHFTLGTVNANAISQNIKRLGDLGLQVEITEADVRYAGDADADILRDQAADYYHLLQACLDNANCTAFITWGVTDAATWLRDSNLGFYSNPTVEPLLFDDDYAPKPAYFALMDLLARKAGVTSPMTDAQVDAMLGIINSPAVEIPPPSMSDAAQLSPDPVAGQVYYAPFPVKITLDGADADWENIPRVTVDSGPMMPPNNDTSFVFAVAADDTNLYFLADVHDSQITYGTHDAGAEWYLEDSVEFYINATGDLSTMGYSDGIAQIALLAANINNADADAPILGGTNAARVGAKAVVVQTDDGYRVEASVPLESDFWSIMPENMETLGFQAHLNDASDASGRDTKLIWSAADTDDQSYSNPSLFGQLVFWDVNP